MDNEHVPALLPQALQLAEAAGEVVLTEYQRLATSNTPILAVKDDQSPLTTADVASHRILAAGLAAIGPRFPVLSEEGSVIPYDERARWNRLWLIDPLDGTKEFLAHNGEFTVNVAFVVDHVPVLGIVHAPALHKTYWAIRGTGAFVHNADTAQVRRIHASDYRKAVRLKVVVSRSHAGSLTEKFLSAIRDCESKAVGSSLKLCAVAEGSAHLYPRFGTTMEWDTAAGHCILREACGTITDLRGRELQYNKEDLRNPFFMATGKPPFPWQHFLEDL